MPCCCFTITRLTGLPREVRPSHPNASPPLAIIPKCVYLHIARVQSSLGLPIPTWYKPSGRWQVAISTHQTFMTPPWRMLSIMSRIQWSKSEGFKSNRINCARWWRGWHRGRQQNVVRPWVTRFRIRLHFCISPLSLRHAAMAASGSAV